MAKNLIIFGEINLKHLLPFFLALGQIIYNTFIRYFPGEKQNMVLDLYSTSIGFISTLLIPHILKFTNIEIKNDKVKAIQRRKCLHYFLLILFYMIYDIMKAIPQAMKGSFTDRSQKIANPFSEGPFTNMGIEMVALTVVSIFLLKYKYYIHHIIAIASFIILGTISDGILGYYPQMIKYGWLINFMEVLSIVSDVFNYYYQKYMMEVLYYPYWRISFTMGIALFCLASAFLIYVLIDKDKSTSKTAMISEFYLYFEEVHPGLIVGKQLLIIVIMSINTALTMLNIYYFNPNFFLISFHLAKFVQILIDEDPEKFYCLIFFFLQFISLLIYLEIIELNFCNLNKNTKRNIELRGIEDFSGDNGRDSTVEEGKLDINPDYYLKFGENDNNQKETNIEMLPQSDENSIDQASIN